MITKTRIKTSNQRGDTIIEAILAMALITLVLFTTWSLTNRSSQLSLAARKRIVMVNHLKEEAEIIRGWRDGAASASDFRNAPQLAGKSVAVGSVPVNPCDESRSAVPPNSFNVSLNSSGGFDVTNNPKTVESDPTSQVWVQVEDDPSATNKQYIDFYLNACWHSGGSVQKEENSQILMRLNT